PLVGRYTITWTRSAAFCTPLPLPIPLIADSSKYAPLPMGSVTYHLSAQVRLDGSSIAMIPQRASGDSIADLTFTGSLRPNDSAIFARSSVRNEGLRAGCHAFSLIDTGRVDAQFVPLVETPPGRRIEVDLFGGGASTFIFHDGGPSGREFTTCTVTDTVSGSKDPD